MCITCANKVSAPNFNLYECVCLAGGGCGGGEVFIPPRNSLTLAGCPGIQFNPDTAQTQHQIAQVKALVLQDWPPFQMPIASLGCYLCFWLNDCKSASLFFRTMAENMASQLYGHSASRQSQLSFTQICQQHHMQHHALSYMCSRTVLVLQNCTGRWIK